MIDPLMEQLLPGFVDEAKEIIDRCAGHLIELEKAHDASRFDDLARGLHTLKGSSATLGLDELSNFAHRMEDVVLPLRGNATPVPGALADAILRTLDVWMAHLRATTAKSDLPDLAPSLQLLASVRHAVQADGPEERAPRRTLPPPPVPDQPSEPAAPEAGGAPGEEAGSWRVRTREVTSLLHEVERLREVRLRMEERRRELGRGVQQ